MCLLVEMEEFTLTAKEIFTGETDNVEFKVDIPPKSEKYMKTVVAFANGNGGKLVFGVEDNTWNIVGFSKDEVFQKMDAITNAIFDSCEPKITPNVAIQEVEGKAIIIVEIISGMQKPYYILSQGIIDGTYIRVAGSTRHAERYRVQELILEGSNRSYDQVEQAEIVTEEDITVLCDKLYAHAIYLCNSNEAKAQIQKVTKNQLLSWRLLVEKNGEYYPTNGYRLLDGKNNQLGDASIQCAVFKGTVRDIFITRKEFSGSVYEQIEKAYEFVLQHINLGSRIEGIARQDFYELPIKTIREIISNAVCHRSYLTPGKIQVALFDDRLEVTSPGMLDNEITIEKMITGLSKIRNKGIAAAFAYMNIVEAWGSGIPKMFHEAQEYGLPEPKLIDMGSDFRVNLYRRIVEIDSYGIVNPRKGVTKRTEEKPISTDKVPIRADKTRGENDKITLSINERKALEYLQNNPRLTNRLVQELCGIKETASKNLLRKLAGKELIIPIGEKRAREYVLPNKFEEEI